MKYLFLVFILSVAVVGHLNAASSAEEEELYELFAGLLSNDDSELDKRERAQDKYKNK